MADENSIPLPPRVRDLTGQVYGRLTVAGYAGKIGTKQCWHCVCTCGTRRTISSNSFRTGNAKSCGCLQLEAVTRAVRQRCTTHGWSKTTEYRAYCHAKERCNNPNVEKFRHYGGRGIRFEFDSFEQFIAELGPRPAGCSIDRIDNDGHYAPGNVRWSTKTEQIRNRSVATILPSGARAADAAEAIGLVAQTILERLKRGWCEPCATSIPARSGSCQHRQASHSDSISTL